MDINQRVWKNIANLLAKQEENQNLALRAMKEDLDCREHLKILHEVLRLILTVVINKENQEGEKLVLAEFGNRIHNDCMAAYALILRGFYHVATMPLRSLLECAYLLHYFAQYPEKIADWKKVKTKEWGKLIEEDKKLKKQFEVKRLKSEYKKTLGEARVKIERREEVDAMYEFFCELGVHPTFRGHFSMFRDRDSAKPMWGAYYDWEKVKVFLIMLGNCGFFALSLFLAAFEKKIVDSDVYSSWKRFRDGVWRPWVKKYGRIVNKEGLEKLRNLPIE